MKRGITIDELIKIDDYIKGNLSDTSVIQLWIDFLKSEELYEYFLIELFLKEYFTGTK